MIKGAFKSFRHQHHFETIGDQTVMKDIFDYQSPFGIVGRLADNLFLKNYMTDLLNKRNEMIKKVAENGRWEVDTIVSHSFGGVATTYALFQNKDVHIKKYVLLTTPDKFTERIDDVAQMIGITQKVQDLLIERFRKETGKEPTILNVSEFVQDVGVKNALIIHDKGDKVIPIERSKNVQRHWPNASLIEVEGTGHFRILRDKETLKKVIDWLAL